ncbi:MAG: hypothetical protein D6785_11625, partial [Planctomycetota bacterium]
ESLFSFSLIYDSLSKILFCYFKAMIDESKKLCYNIIYISYLLRKILFILSFCKKRYHYLPIGS